MMGFFKRHMILCLVLFMVPLIIVFYITKRLSCGTAEYIALISGIFTYYGTVILALVTVMQNDHLMLLQERSSQIEETKIKEANRPWFIFDAVTAYSLFGQYTLEHESIATEGFEITVQGIIPPSSESINFFLRNESNILAKNVMLYGFGPLFSSIGSVPPFGYQDIKYKEVSGGGTICLCYNVEKAITKTYRFNMTYENAYGHHFYNKIYIMVSDIKGVRRFSFSIGKQVDGEEKLNLQTENVKDSCDLCPPLTDLLNSDT